MCTATAISNGALSAPRPPPSIEPESEPSISECLISGRQDRGDGAPSDVDRGLPGALILEDKELDLLGRGEFVEVNEAGRVVARNCGEQGQKSSRFCESADDYHILSSLGRAR